ncbi:acetate/propionate family kinase [Roseicyclus sp.]|uniref:acetate/propionate family kinase n=1 Tax=Roseicyclus sp. TaxID=1914329 RepID=UPI003F6CF09F
MRLILTLNAGSSSLKAALYDGAADLAVARVTVSALGDDARLALTTDGQTQERAIGQADHARAFAALRTALAPMMGPGGPVAIGHRIVHGGAEIDGPRLLTPPLIAMLKRLVPLAPLHQPHNLALIRAATKAFPQAVQVGAFDTAFHRGHDWVNDTYALPRRYFDQGIRRYGFHGLSYAFIAAHLAQTRPDLADGRLIVAHLGNGASLCAIKGGRSVASSMGFSALDGLPMGTRVGQIDPGVLLYLMGQGMDQAALMQLLYSESGLKGLSGISHDMRVLLAAESPAADAAIAYFCARLAQEIGGLAAVLGGIDGLIFTGGIGQNAAPIRGLALEKLAFLGLVVDEGANAANEPTIGKGKVPILVTATDEEQMIAAAVREVLLAGPIEGKPV